MGKDKDNKRRKEMKGEGRRKEGGRLPAGMTIAESLSPILAKIL